ncbi:MAG: hypothetical protein PUG70_06715 [Lachnospiraceae bacterium]|nr:hypothetical protein [Lachnospiraceae bacterium]MDY5522190.1 hypothetical protein [Agathobacter sp.]
MKKIKRMLVGIRLAAMTITAVIGDSTMDAEAKAKVKRCTEAEVEVGQYRNAYIKKGKTFNLI